MGKASAVAAASMARQVRRRRSGIPMEGNHERLTNFPGLAHPLVSDGKALVEFGFLESGIHFATKHTTKRTDSTRSQSGFMGIGRGYATEVLRLRNITTTSVVLG